MRVAASVAALSAMPAGDEASMSGVCPRLFCAFTLALPSTSSRTMLTWPRRAARARGSCLRERPTRERPTKAGWRKWETAYIGGNGRSNSLRGNGGACPSESAQRTLAFAASRHLSMRMRRAARAGARTCVISVITSQCRAARRRGCTPSSARCSAGDYVPK